jgi:hypothetical protein
MAPPAPSLVATGSNWYDGSLHTGRPPIPGSRGHAACEGAAGSVEKLAAASRATRRCTRMEESLKPGGGLGRRDAATGLQRGNAGAGEKRTSGGKQVPGSPVNPES